MCPSTTPFCHWLNLAGEWVPLDSLNYALTMRSLVGWSHLHDWVKKATADLQRVPTEISDTPAIKFLPLLADRIEERFEQRPIFFNPATHPGWLKELGTLLARTRWEDSGEQDRVRRLGRDLAQSRWQVVPALEILPYIDGTPAGTASTTNGISPR